MEVRKRYTRTVSTNSHSSVNSSFRGYWSCDVCWVKHPIGLQKHIPMTYMVPEAGLKCFQEMEGNVLATNGLVILVTLECTPVTPGCTLVTPGCTSSSWVTLEYMYVSRALGIFQGFPVCIKRTKHKISKQHTKT